MYNQIALMLIFTKEVLGMSSVKDVLKKGAARMTEAALRKELKSSANSTACGFMYQQPAPEKLANFRKVR